MFGYSFSPNRNYDMVAAVDLGSNSFHLIVARVTDGQVQIIDKVREMVRLAAGLNDDKEITEDAEARALACLERFGQRLRELPQGSVRAVGTNTLRAARNGETFRRKAEAALGHPIEVIAGREEARLVYLGVAQGLQSNGERRLVVDIGGGSTEAIVGEDFRTIKRESLHMGCVSMSVKHFPDGKITHQSMRRAIIDARLKLQPTQSAYAQTGWSEAIGSSGTIKSIANIIRENNLSDKGITHEAMLRLGDLMIQSGHINNLDLPGLNEDRRAVIAGGYAVLMGVFEGLHINQMTASKEALREGLIYDLLGRIRHEDARERTAKAIAKRFSVDHEQSLRVRQTALTLLEHISETWQLQGEDPKRMLRWAARLHEVGMAVSHTQYHKHGAYLLENADLSGFSRQDQNILAVLVRGHRRKFPNSAFKNLPAFIQPSAKRLCVILRLAVLLHRNRSQKELPVLALKADGNKLKLKFPKDWIEHNPLTQEDLEQEAAFLKAAGIRLKVKSQKPTISN